ncbi:MAG TPA: glycosyltransferase family 2 protein [Opitutaceae bacterium]|nr:glycosyltransferase family 2 protein [Opitutaceae bacterium]
MQVSFIIPLYNCLPLTQAMVASLRATLPAGLRHEIILVDDGSTDGTRAWLATLRPPFRVLLNERNLGYAAANNRGAAVAQGEFLALLNNDLVLATRWLEPMLAAHRRLGARAGLVGNVQRDLRTGAIDHAGIFINAKGKPEHERELPGWSWLPGCGVRRVDAVTGACVLLERRLWTELGGFDERYVNGCEDVDLCLRAAAAGRIHAVALDSRVGHHVSASPGRKARNEENAYRLAARWRDTLVRLGVRRWSEHYLATLQAGPLDAIEQAKAWGIFGYAFHLRRGPSPAAVAGMNAALDREFSRWREMFGPL